MKNTLKTLLAVLSSLALTVSSNAGELSVNGSAEATYIIGGSDDSQGKGLGITNELNFKAAGEFASGYTWAYSMELDGATTANDDTSLTLGLGNMGTFAIGISELGLSQELAYGVGAYAVGSDAVNVGKLQRGLDISEYNNIQYHTPADLLPFGIMVKGAFSPNLAGTSGSSGKGGNTIESDYSATGLATSKLVGQAAQMFAIKASPIDGLTVGADYFTATGEAALTNQKYESGNAFVKYATGPFVVGYGETLIAPAALNSAAAPVQLFENSHMGVQFAVNDALSVSVNRESSNRKSRAAILATAAGQVKATVETEVDIYQVAYNVGGATLALIRSEAGNANYTAGNEVETTLFSLKMAF